MSDEKRGPGSPADPDSSLGPTLHKPPLSPELDTLVRTPPPTSGPPIMIGRYRLLQ